MKKSFNVIPAQQNLNTKNNLCFNTSFPLTSHPSAEECLSWNSDCNFSLDANFNADL